MFKKFLFYKKLIKLVLSITKGIESFFSFFHENFFKKKKNYSKNFQAIDKRIFFIFVFIFITISSYFLLPALYDNDKIRIQLEKQIFDKYNLEVKFDKSLKYGLLPKPHFFSDNVFINYKSDEIGQSKNTKIYFFIKNLFSSDNIIINNLVFKKTDFKVNNSNYKFFIKLLEDNKTNQNIDFINSKLFYLNKNDDIIFLTDLKSLNYSNEENFKKINSNFKLFNIPISFDVDHNPSEKSVLTEIDSHQLRLNIKNYFTYDDKKTDGQLDIILINKTKKINYIFENNALKFNTDSNKISGDINIKPFFLSSNFKISRIDLKKIFRDNSIFENLLNSEILNNKNLNGKINFIIDDVEGINFLDKVNFSILLEEGDIFIDNLTTIFKESVKINLNDVQLINNNNNLTFAGYMSLDFIDAMEFYAHYQLNRIYRKNIKKINFGFLFNFDNKFIEINNLKVDGKTNQNLEKFLNNFNSKKENIFNKIVIRNSIKSFFKNF
tara:strand:- start:2666 stop:4150 length:1485 start_codon:yes stop_codon:yes gene_type:complete